MQELNLNISQFTKLKVRVSSIYEHVTQILWFYWTTDSWIAVSCQKNTLCPFIEFTDNSNKNTGSHEQIYMLYYMLIHVILLSYSQGRFFQQTDRKLN